MKRLRFGLLAALASLLSAAPAYAACETMRVTGYSSGDYPGLTASGLPTRGNEWTLVASHPRFSFGQVLEVEGLGPLVVADRGRLGTGHIDVLVPSRADAFALTGYREVCWE
jgi:3D (Asp-Asp-Asp) domain-containing protein